MDRAEVSRRLTPARIAAVLALAGALLAGTFGARPAAAAPPGPQVIVYGDSLVFEAAPYAEQILRDVAQVPAIVIGAPGGATCDLLPRMRADASRYRPSDVVIAFSGNAFGPCMQDSQGQSLRGDAWLAAYRKATLEAIAVYAPDRSTIWLGTTPISLTSEKEGVDDVHRLEAMQRDLARRDPRVHVVDSAAAVLDHGYWTRALPCLPNEPCTGGVDIHLNRVNTVRAPDTAHFCPVPYPKLESCPVYASGGLRYALGLLVPALRAHGWFDRSRVATSLAAGWSG